MCLPPGLAVTLLRLLQFLLSLLNLKLSDSRSVAPNKDCRPCQCWNNIGSLSPYHNAPAVPGVSANLPDDCTVDQVVLLHRHNACGPMMEQVYIQQLIDTLEDAGDVIQGVNLPPYLEFLKERYGYDLVPEELTITGRKELLDHGIRFALRYPTLSTGAVVSTSHQSVADSAYFFVQGFLGRKAKDVTFLANEDSKDPVSWLVPWESCPKLSRVEPSQVAKKWAEKYVPPIVERLNKLIPGVGLSLDDVRGALYACPYELAAHNRSPWCEVFTTHELRDLEYELDLLLGVYSGHVSRSDPGPLGAFYIKKLIERLTDTTKDATPLYLDFAHAYSMLFPLSTMGLIEDSVSLSPPHYHPARHRKSMSSSRVLFAAEMIWEKFTCKETFRGPQVRLVLNGATFPLSTCEQTENDKKYGTCSLDAFVRENEYSMSVEYGSDVWNTTCELGRQP